MAAMVAELQAGTRHESLVNANDLVKKLLEIADAPMQKPVRASDKIAAIDKMAKIGGLYRDSRKDPESVRITQVTVVLNHNSGETRRETHQLNTPPPGTVDGESQIVDEPGDSPA